MFLLARIQEFSSGGVQVSLTKKALTFFFFFFVFFLLVLSLFYRSQMVNFKEIYHFSRFQKGSNIFQGGGGSNFFQGGSNCLFPIDTHITCDFPGGVRTPCPPSGSTLVLQLENLRLIRLCMHRLILGFSVHTCQLVSYAGHRLNLSEK